MKKLMIYCCSGMGREIADLSRYQNQMNKRWSDIFFVDDVTNGHIVNGIPVISFDEVINKYEKDNLEFIVTAGEPVARELLYKKIINNSLSMINIMYPGFFQSDYLEIGTGNIIHWGAILTCNIKIGNGCFFNKNSVVGHDVTIGDYCFISVNVSIGGCSEIGNNVFVGSGAVIRDRVRIGDHSIIGMGSIVTKDVAPYSVMVGNPAKLVKKNLDNKVFRHTNFLK